MIHIALLFSLFTHTLIHLLFASLWIWVRSCGKAHIQIEDKIHYRKRFFMALPSIHAQASFLLCQVCGAFIQRPFYWDMIQAFPFLTAWPFSVRICGVLNALTTRLNICCYSETILLCHHSIYSYGTKVKVFIVFEKRGESILLFANDEKRSESNVGVCICLYTQPPIIDWGNSHEQTTNR